MEIKISGYPLDQEQTAIVTDKSKYLLVVAGAGSGKTLTILGKIYYLIFVLGIKKEEILCISFTKASSQSLKEKIKKEFNLDMDVYTFHKLSLEILKDKEYQIADSNILDMIVHDFFYKDVLQNESSMNYILKYFKQKYHNIEKYLSFLEKNKDDIKRLEILCTTFIHLFKCNGYEMSNFTSFLKIAKKNWIYYFKDKYFLIIVLNIYLQYERYLNENNEIDFNDMIIYATKRIKDEGLEKQYRYVIIDEYQDSSYVRVMLIKELIDICNASLMVVGDDFQSIYRFTGCDLSLFLAFSKYFEGAKVMKIQNTYRNSQELITIAGDFVMKNKEQIKKNLKSHKHLLNPIQIVYYKDKKKDFTKLVLKVYEETKKPILVLGRNNKDIDDVLDLQLFKKKEDKIIYLSNQSITLTYLTVHKSKGLEEENVILINLEDRMLGFPNKIKDERVLSYVTKEYEKYPYAEERRLFYVALTRTKNYVFLFVPLERKAMFVKELLKYHSIKKYLL